MSLTQSQIQTTIDRTIAVVLPALKAQKGQTARDLNVDRASLRVLEEAGFITAAHTIAEGARPNTNAEGKLLRGRPEHTFKLTKKGNDKVRRMKPSEQPVEAPQEAVAA